MSAVATITDKHGKIHILDKCIGFSFTTNRYSPSSEFYGKFAVNEVVTDIKAVSISISGVIVQVGFVYNASYERSSRGLSLVLKSRPFSALLEQNHVRPDMYPSMSMNKIHSNLVSFSGVSAEPSSTTVNYIIVKDNATAWDCYTQLCLRLWGVLPYVTAQNQVRFSLHSPALEVSLTPPQIVSTQACVNAENVISDVHMRDTNGNYDIYTAHSDTALAYGITRHRHIGWDKAWLANIPMGLRHRLDFSAKGIRSSSVTYIGFNGEQIYDRVTMSEQVGGIKLVGAKIAAVRVLGSKKGVRTTLSCYNDRYMS